MREFLEKADLPIKNIMEPIPLIRRCLADLKEKSPKDTDANVGRRSSLNVWIP